MSLVLRGVGLELLAWVPTLNYTASGGQISRGVANTSSRERLSFCPSINIHEALGHQPPLLWDRRDRLGFELASIGKAPPGPPEAGEPELLGAPGQRVQHLLSDARWGFWPVKDSYLIWAGQGPKPLSPPRPPPLCRLSSWLLLSLEGPCIWGRTQSSTPKQGRLARPIP